MILANRFTTCIYQLLKFNFLCLFLFSIPQDFFAQPTSQTFNVSGTYTVPSGYAANVTIEAWGAGGGGGSNTSGAKGGGGGGAYASLTTTLTAGSYTVTVGTGGGAGTGGGNSSFTTIVVAEGGFSTTGTTGGGGGTTAGSTGSAKIAGANGANASGDNGGAGGTGANGGGAGGAGGAANNGSGAAGTAPGGGGGGKAGPGNGGVSGAGASGRVVVTVNTVLPVRFGSITAFEKQGGIQINWTSYTEQNLDKYQIEYSDDGNNFAYRGTVNALNTTTANYTFTDQRPVSGNNFYRIRSIDIDGKQALSHIIRINIGNTAKDITLYPNPVQNGILSWQGSLAKGNYALKIFNVAGQRVFEQNFNHTGGAINQSIQLTDRKKAGLYFLRIENEEIKISVKTFIIR
jgi:hypothetical protein